MKLGNIFPEEAKEGMDRAAAAMDAMNDKLDKVVTLLQQILDELRES